MLLFTPTSIKMGQGKPTARISANINGLSAFRYPPPPPHPRLLALRERRKAESCWRSAGSVYVDLPGPYKDKVEHFNWQAF
jgi:hypothetical protein